MWYQLAAVLHVNDCKDVSYRDPISASPFPRQGLFLTELRCLPSVPGGRSCLHELENHEKHSASM